MKAKIIKIGDSISVILPIELIKNYQLKDEIIFELKDDCIILKPIDFDPRADWEELYKNSDTKLTQEDKEWISFQNEFDEKNWT